MKILYAANVFEDFERLKILSEYANEESTKGNKYDLTIISGNIVTRVLEDKELMLYMGATIFENSITNFREEAKKEGIISSFEFQNLLAELKKNNVPEENLEQMIITHIASDFAFLKNSKLAKAYTAAKAAAECFQNKYHTIPKEQILQLAQKNMGEKYIEFRNLLKTFPQQTYGLPGNFDNWLIFAKILQEKDLHLDCTEINGVRIAGYGSTHQPFKTNKNIPPELLNNYQDQRNGAGKFFAELECVGHYINTNPDIIVNYMPPIYGFVIVKEDENGVPEKKNIEFDLNKKCAVSVKPSLFLTGFHYQHYFAEQLIPNLKTVPTVVISPGALGEAPDTLGGEFCSIDLDEEDMFKRVVFYRITDKNQGIASIKPIHGYDKIPGGLKEMIFGQGQLDLATKKQKLSIGPSQNNSPTTSLPTDPSTNNTP